MSRHQFSVHQTLSALRLSIADGVFAHLYANLTGSIFLPAFALALNANPFEIGLLAAIPLFATVAQFFGAVMIETVQRRKRIALWFAFLGRSTWILILLLSLIYADQHPAFFLKMLIIFLMACHSLSSIAGVSWLSWMAGLVPEEIRGRFFGLRNSMLGTVTITITLFGGYFLDWFTRTHPQTPKTWAFEILFTIAIASGLLSLWFLSRQPELPLLSKSASGLQALYRAPLKHENFRRLLRFAFLRSFSTNMAAPFFVVYMLEDLHFSYTTVATMTMLTAFADLTGMWIWGHLSDHLGNRPVIIFTSLVTTILPACWIFTGAGKLSAFLLIPLLNIGGGFHWAGYNLCTVNLVFRMVPREGNAVFFAFWTVFTGLAAGLGSLTGGLLARYTDILGAVLPVTVDSGYKLIFLFSALMRIIPLLFLRTLKEETGLPFAHAIRILRNVKSWAALMGFHPVLHFFLPGVPAPEKSTPYWPIWRFRRSRK